jgi:putative heme transporter
MTTAPHASRRSRKRTIKLTLAALVLVLIITVVIPKFANYRDIGSQLGSVSTKWLIVIVLAELMNLGAFAPNWIVALPGLSYFSSLRLTMSGAAISNLAPMGGPVGMTMQYSMMLDWGFERRDASRAMIVTGIWNQFFNFGMPIVALVLLTARGGKNAALMVAAQIGLPVLLIAAITFVLVLRSDRAAVMLGNRADKIGTAVRRVFRKPPLVGAAQAVSRFRIDSLDLLRRRWAPLTLTTTVGFLTSFATLVCCIRAVGIPGVQITFTEAFAAWACTLLLSAIPLTPGGLGVTDVGLSGALIAFGANQPSAVGAVLLCRAVTWLPPIFLGSLATAWWRRQRARAT